MKFGSRRDRLRWRLLCWKFKTHERRRRLWLRILKIGCGHRKEMSSIGIYTRIEMTEGDLMTGDSGVRRIQRACERIYCARCQTVLNVRCYEQLSPAEERIHDFKKRMSRGEVCS